MKRIIYILNLVWTSIIAFTAPAVSGFIFLCLSGHSKGYDYDLGSEKDISVLIGIVMLVVWLAASLPSLIYVLKKTAEKGHIYLFILFALYIVLAVLCICLTGGFSEYFHSVFNIG